MIKSFLHNEVRTLTIFYMKIVCAYFDPEANFLSPNPQDELEEHELTIVHSYADLKALFVNPLEYNVVLMDVFLPATNTIKRRLPAIVLEHVFKKELVRGVGFFIPVYFEEQYRTSDEFTGTVASRECWTPQGFRDWKKLLELVLEHIP